MTRGYAVGLGAGTQFLALMVWELPMGAPDELAKALLMGASWAINLILDARIVRRRSAIQLGLPRRSSFA